MSACAVELQSSEVTAIARAPDIHAFALRAHGVARSLQCAKSLATSHDTTSSITARQPRAEYRTACSHAARVVFGRIDSRASYRTGHRHTLARVTHGSTDPASERFVRERPRSRVFPNLHDCSALLGCVCEQTHTCRRCVVSIEQTSPASRSQSNCRCSFLGEAQIRWRKRAKRVELRALCVF